MNAVQAIHLFSAFLLLLVGVIVASRRRFQAYTRPFLLFVFVNLCGILAVAAETSPYPVLWPIGYVLLYGYVAFLPFAWYLMGSRWGLDAGERPRKTAILTPIFLLISVFLFVYFWVTGGIDLTTGEGGWYLDFKEMHFWTAAYLIVCLAAGAYAIEVCYRSSLGLSREKVKRSFFPLLAYALGLLNMASVGMLYGRLSALMMTVTFLLAALVSLPVGRHYTLFYPANHGIILTKRAVYSSIVVVLFGVYFIIIGTIGEMLKKYNLDEGMFYSVVVLILLVLTFMILIVSQALRFRFKGASAGATSFRERGPYAAEWKEFAEEISVTMSLDAIYAQTSELLRRLLKIDHSLFVIKEPAPSENYTLYCGQGIDRGIPGERLNLVSEWLYRLGHPVETATLKEKAPQEAAQIAALERDVPFPIFLLGPFVARQQFLGFWGISAHAGERPLTSPEIAFIEAAANPVALTILGARMTDELVVSREIESFHRFSSFVLHDLKNSVAMLSMLMQNAEKNINNPEFQKEMLRTIGQAVNRQKKIISRLTEEKSESRLSLEEVDLAGLVGKTMERVRLDTIRTITVNVEIDGGVMVIVDPEKIGSVFDNLVMNAIEAMPEGGTLEIRTADSSETGVEAVSFRDTGIGMEQEFIATRLFKPFISTKPYGLGIGMYQSREIVKAHRGRLEVTSEPGKGTEVIVYLPGVGGFGKTRNSHH
jgi:putative PEP-CTERM system histidine kinase